MYALDFGPTALLKCEEFGVDLKRLDAVYITHLHGDHIGGIAMLLVYLQFRMERTRPLVIAGPEGVEERLALLRESAYRRSSSPDSTFRLNLCTGRFPAHGGTWAPGPGDPRGA